MAPGGKVCHMEDVREGRGHLHVLKHLDHNYNYKLATNMLQHLGSACYKLVTQIVFKKKLHKSKYNNCKV